MLKNEIMITGMRVASRFLKAGSGVARNFRLLTRRNYADRVSITLAESVMRESLERTAASAFEGIEEVESVYIRQRAAVASIVTVVNDENDAVFERIYECESSLRRRMPNLKFDFNIIVRRGRDVREFVGANVPIWQRAAHTNTCH